MFNNPPPPLAHPDAYTEAGERWREQSEDRKREGGNILYKGCWEWGEDDNNDVWVCLWIKITKCIYLVNLLESCSIESIHFSIFQLTNL